MNKGNDSLAAIDESGKIGKISFRIPLSIAYATSIKTIKEKTNILEY